MSRRCVCRLLARATSVPARNAPGNLRRASVRVYGVVSITTTTSNFVAERIGGPGPFDRAAFPFTAAEIAAYQARQPAGRRVLQARWKDGPWYGYRLTAVAHRAYPAPGEYAPASEAAAGECSLPVAVRDGRGWCDPLHDRVRVAAVCWLATGSFT